MGISRNWQADSEQPCLQVVRFSCRLKAKWLSDWLRKVVVQVIIDIVGLDAGDWILDAGSLDI